MRSKDLIYRVAINEAHKGVVAEAIEIKVDWCVGGDAELGEKVVVFKNEKGHGIFAIGLLPITRSMKGLLSLISKGPNKAMHTFRSKGLHSDSQSCALAAR